MLLRKLLVLRLNYQQQVALPDGRFIANVSDQVVEFGPLNATIHKINECIDMKDIEPLKNIYKLTLHKILT
jgi:succinyl-diaminopimelate desuccinylase